MARLTIRPLQREDIESVGRYWTQVSPADLARMGVDPSKVTSTLPFRETLEAWLRTPEDKQTFFPMVWMVDGRPVGYSTLKDLRVGEEGSLHTHVWDRSMRGKGYGAPLVCLTAVSLYERFRLQLIRCEPKVDNPHPNRMLAKVGFPLERIYFGASSDLAAPCELASYRVERVLAEKFLARYRRHADGGVVP